MNERAKCIDACWDRPECTVCHKIKAPRGRDVPLAFYGSYCTMSWKDEPGYCEGYEQDPQVGHYWSKDEEEWGW